ncbi:acyltransferase family protein [Paraprevotella clara]|uniref:acyltransferase family protein n=2 Tax=Paraprevotella clara TaxID=454154 RepID=UPI002674BE37|nr:acyltransferase [Paraprevotella clara]
MRKLDVVNFLRGYSISTIVIMHLVGMLGISGIWEKAAAFGGAGVHVFILCSGFGLYLSYLRKPLGYIAFLKKRFTRIYMPMAVLCVATAVWMACMGREWFMPLLGNLLLFKMFVPELESSMGGQMWFVSTIIQFYLAWPLIVKLFNIRGGVKLALIVSLLWSTTVGLLGYAEERVWNSFFLQYLWEFCLGMKMAEIYHDNPKALEVPRWKYLLTLCVAGVGLTGIMGFAGWPWKLYNDIPSLMGYMSLALIIYKVGIKPLNRLLEWTNRFSYEWYLVHMLVFDIIFYYIGHNAPIAVVFVLCLLLSYSTAIAYSRIWSK